MAEAQVGIRILLNDGASGGLSSLGGILRDVGLGALALGDSWGRLDPTTKALGITALATGLAFRGLVGLLKDATDAAMALQSSMLQVQLNVDGASAHIQPLTQLIFDLGGRTRYSSEQIAQGFVQIGVHGIDATDILNGVGSAAIYMAEAMGQDDATEAAALLSSTLQMFNLDAAQAEGAANDLLFAFRHGLPDVSQLQTALQQVGPAAALLKIPLSDLTGALGFLGEAGLSGSKSGTSLRFMLQALTDPTAKAQKELADLGVVVVNSTTPAFDSLIGKLQSAGGTAAFAANHFDGTLGSLNNMYTQAQKFGLLGTDETLYQWGLKTGTLSDKLFDASGNFAGFNNMLIQLGQNLEKMPPDQKFAALQNLFNVRAGQGADEFLQNLPAALAALQQFQTAQSNTDVSKQATQQYNTLSVALKGLHTTWTNFLASIGASNLGPLTGMAHGLNGALGGVASSIQGGNTQLGNFIGTGLTALTAVTGLTFAASSGALAWKTLGPLTKGVGEGFGNMLSPITNLSGVLPGLGGMMKDAFTGNGLVNFVGMLQNFNLAHLSNSLKDAGGFMKVFDGGAKSFVTGGLGMLKGGFLELVPAIGSFAVAAAPVILAIAIIAAVIVVVVLLFTQFKTEGQQIASMFGSVIGPVFKQVGDTIGSVAKNIGAEWTKIQPQLSTAMKGITTAILGMKPTFEFIASVISGSIQIILHVVGGLVQGFIAALPPIINIFTGIFTIIGNITKLIIAIFSGQWGQIPGLIKGIFGSVFSILGNAVDAVLALGGNIVMGLLHGLMSGVQAIGGFPLAIVQAVVGGIKSLFGIHSPSTVLSDIGINMVLGLMGGLLTIEGKIITWVAGVGLAILDGIGKLVGSLASMGTNLAKGLFSGLENGMINVVSNIPVVGGQLAGKIRDFFGIHSPSTMFAEIGKNLSDGLIVGMTNVDVATAAKRHFASLNAGVVPVGSSMMSPAMSALMAQSASSASGQGMITNKIYLDGKQIATNVTDRLGKQLTSQGVGRYNR